jgi:hypothetical protein
MERKEGMASGDPMEMMDQGVIGTEERRFNEGICCVRIMRKGRRSACLDEDEGMKEVC